MGTNAVQRHHNAAKSEKQSKSEKLLANPDVSRWYNNLVRSSPTTAGPCLRKLGRFCEIHQMTPMQLAELGMKDIRAIADLLQDHISSMQEEGKAPQYIKSVMTATKSWLKHFDVEPKRDLKIANVDSTPTLANERVPIAEEMAEISNRAPPREGVSISFMAKAGLRPEVLGNHDGTDGLMMKDLPDIAIVQGRIVCIRNPPMVIVRSTLSKAGHQYFTFLSSNGTKKLTAYLNQRLLDGESLNETSPVISPDTVYSYGRGRKNEHSKRRFLPTSRVSGTIRDALRPRFSWRPYVFRAYFDTELLIAEARGKIAHDFRVFFMGHKGSIESKYTTNKQILPDALIQEMREAYKRSEELLDLEGQSIDPLLWQREQVQEAVLKATAEELGKMQEVLRSLGIGNIRQASV